MSARPHPRSLARQRGAALLLFALLFLIAGIGYFLSRVGDSGLASRSALTSNGLEQARAALIGYAATYRDTHPNEMFGFLPCPDTNNDGNAEANCNDTNEVVIGRLPYKTLGIAAPRDSTGECLWYAVGHFKNAPTPGPKTQPLNWDTPGHFRIVDQDGKELAKPDDLFGGAAAVIFAPGPPLTTQNRPTGNGECSGDASNSFAAYLDAGYASPSTASLATPYAITAGRETANDTNNDRVAWIAPQEIFSQRIKLRSDFVAGVNAMNNNVQACLQVNMPAPDPITGVPNPADKLIGRVPASCAVTLPTGYYSHYGDQLLYARCPTVGSRCMTVNGQTCDGVLFFGGERAAGQVRLTTAQKNTPANYLEGANLTNFVNSSAPVAPAFVGASSFSATKFEPPASGDVALCLVQELSFANDIGRLDVVSPTVGTEQFARVDTSAKTVTLGSASVTANPGDTGAGDLYACTWFSDVRNFGSGLRAYFIADFQQIGEGMTFVIADADKNPNTQRCGGAGQLMGYAATGHNAASPINFPKIGLEFDTAANNGYNEAAGQELTGRNDDLLAAVGVPHTGFVFWGNSFANAAQFVANPGWDDNVHNKGGDTSPAGYTDPRNPVTNFKKMKGAGVAGVDKYVIRMDIRRTRNAAAKRSTYVLKAWVFAKNGEGSCYGGAIGSGAADLNDDFENLFFWPPSCTTPFSETTTVLDEGDNEAFRTFRVGFTTGQSNRGQTVVISGFKLRAIP